jgi:hypothetical protein
MEAEGDIPVANAGDNINEDHNSLTLTISMSDGDLSHNAPPNFAGQANEEVNQVIESPPLNFIEPDVVSPVIVNGDQPALNLENFGIPGIGV